MSQENVLMQAARYLYTELLPNSKIQEMPTVPN